MLHLMILAGESVLMAVLLLLLASLWSVPPCSLRVICLSRCQHMPFDQPRSHDDIELKPVAETGA